MNKIELKNKIFIEGFDIDIDYINQCKNYCKEELIQLIFTGKTSEIPEELAKKCVEVLAKTNLGCFYRNYQYNKPQPVSFTKCIAKESIQSACQSEFCIIYKTSKDVSI